MVPYVLCIHFPGSSAVLENGIIKDFLHTLIHCVCELHSLIKPLIIAHLAYYSREKLIKTCHRLGEGVGGFCLYVSKGEALKLRENNWGKERGAKEKRLPSSLRLLSSVT